MDKPRGPTSHDMVDRIRRALRTRRVGHAGTLDPFATGVLVVCIGKATRLARFLSGGTKAYRALVRLGFATTTDDLTGEPLGPIRPVEVATPELERALRRLLGQHDQVPPAFAARHVGGRRLYALARQGQRVQAAPSTVRIEALRLLRHEGERFEVEVECSPGTYIRALARDLGEALGTGGHLEALRRLRSGCFGLEGAVSGDAIDVTVSRQLLPLRDLLGEMPEIAVGPEGVAVLSHGGMLGPVHALGSSLVLEGERYRLRDAEGELLALGRLTRAGSDWEIHPDVVLAEP